MCSHKYDPTKYIRLDSNKRRRILPIGKILEYLRPLEDLVVIDVGCGTGYFAIPFGAEVGAKGKVYAVDNSVQMLTLLRQRIAEPSNLEIILSEESHIPLKDRIADVVFMSAVYHEFDDRPKMIKELIRLAKPDARFAVIDWSQYSNAQGPPMRHRVPKEIVIQEFLAEKFELTNEFEPSRYFYGLIFEKSIRKDASLIKKKIELM